MIEIKDLLTRVQNLVLAEEYKKESIQQVITEVTSIPIEKSQVEIKDGTVYLNLRPIYKNEIFIKKDQIQKLLEEKLGRKSPRDIR